MNRTRSFRVKSRALIALLAISGLAFAAPVAAIAQTVDVAPTDEQYDTQEILGISDQGGPGGGLSDPAPAVGGDNVGELPFTGLDVAAIAAIGIGLAGGGFVVRRASRAGANA